MFHSSPNINGFITNSCFDVGISDNPYKKSLHPSITFNNISSYNLIPRDFDYYKIIGYWPIVWGAKGFKYSLLPLKPFQPLLRCVIRWNIWTIDFIDNANCASILITRDFFICMSTWDRDVFSDTSFSWSSIVFVSYFMFFVFFYQDTYYSQISVVIKFPFLWAEMFRKTFLLLFSICFKVFNVL